MSLDKIKTGHFHSTKCFIDYLSAINDSREFGKSICDIHPKEL